LRALINKLKTFELLIVETFPS